MSSHNLCFLHFAKNHTIHAMKPVLSLDISSGSTFFILFARQAEANLYEQLSSEIGLQFFKYCLSLFDFGIQVIIPSFV